MIALSRRRFGEIDDEIPPLVEQHRHRGVFLLEQSPLLDDDMEARRRRGRGQRREGGSTSARRRIRAVPFCLLDGMEQCVAEPDGPRGRRGLGTTAATAEGPVTGLVANRMIVSTREKGNATGFTG